MLNELGDHQQDFLPVFFFNAPLGSTLRTYTYRANQSMAPESHVQGLQAIKVPMLVLAAEKDEVFSAAILVKTVEKHSTAKTQVIPAATHDGILQHPKTFEAIRFWLTSWAQ
jgi:pimeloyl-ACP methyl ester carboxylesterase